MTEQEKIQALKQNKMAFGLMPQELQNKTEKIGLKWFECWQSECKWYGDFSINSEQGFIRSLTYRLKSDYTEEPEQIELEIFHGCGMLKVSANGAHFGHTQAPALCPKEGFMFAAFRYNSTLLSTLNTLPCLNRDGRVMFPTHAIYKKGV